MAKKIKLDHAGIASVLKSAGLATAVTGTAERVASGAGHTTRKGEVIQVKVDSYVTDRVAAGVTLAHPAGNAIEAKHGTLVRAASAAGLEVTAR